MKSFAEVLERHKAEYRKLRDLSGKLASCSGGRPVSGRMPGR
jgi:hypothetical protein